MIEEELIENFQSNSDYFLPLEEAQKIENFIFTEKNDKIGLMIYIIRCMTKLLYQIDDVIILEPYANFIFGNLCKYNCKDTLWILLNKDLMLGDIMENFCDQDIWLRIFLTSEWSMVKIILSTYTGCKIFHNNAVKIYMETIDVNYFDISKIYKVWNNTYNNYYCKDGDFPNFIEIFDEVYSEILKRDNCAKICENIFLKIFDKVESISLYSNFLLFISECICKDKNIENSISLFLILRNYEFKKEIKPLTDNILLLNIINKF